MATHHFIPSLFLFTLVGVALIAIIGYALFLRKRGNRHPVESPDKAGQTMAPTKEEHGVGL